MVKLHPNLLDIIINSISGTIIVVPSTLYNWLKKILSMEYQINMYGRPLPLPFYTVNIENTYVVSEKEMTGVVETSKSLSTKIFSFGIRSRFGLRIKREIPSIIRDAVEVRLINRWIEEYIDLAREKYRVRPAAIFITLDAVENRVFNNIIYSWPAVPCKVFFLAPDNHYVKRLVAED